MTATKSSSLDLAFAALTSKDNDAILTALTRIEKDGDARAIKPLLHALTKVSDSRVQQRITAMLYEVKAVNSTTELLDALDDPDLAPVRHTILATFWNAGLDVRDHLARFVTIALEGNAEACFECLTVIENQEIWPENDARTALKRVEKAAVDEEDTYKGSMLNDIVAVLRYRLGKDED